jgi:preprotein translocase subunit SecE
MRTVLQPRWFREVRDELRKVTWPTVEQTRSLTLVVLVVAALLGLFLGGLDYGFNWLIENTVLR